MELRLGYFPVFDAALVLRQVAESVRFSPFSPEMEAAARELGAEELARVEAVGAATRNWLGVLEALIAPDSAGTLGAEEGARLLAREPERALPRLTDGMTGTAAGRETTLEAAHLLALVLDKGIAPLAARQSRRLKSAVDDLDAALSGMTPWDYFLGLTDRVCRKEAGILGFRIKPEFSMAEAEVERLIVLPSLVATRRLIFWHRGRDLVFFVAAEARQSDDEPADGLLLATLALADRTRLKMLRRLASGPCGNNEMAQALGVNPSTASRHFKLFKDAGFVELRGEGARLEYEFSRKAVEAAFASILGYIEGGTR